MIDVACFGTSLTWVYHWQPEVVRILETNGVRAKLYNVGASGQNSGWGVSNLSKVTGIRPRFALIEFCMNDCAVMSVATATANTLDIINGLKASMPPAGIFLMTMNPTVGTGALAAARTALPSHYANYRSLAVSEGVRIVDIADIWASQYVAGDIPDGIHPTVAANKRVTAPTIAGEILSAI